MTGGRKDDAEDRRRSAEARQRARETIQAFNRRRHLHPLCGAKARTTGEPCANFAQKNGRCRFHGGATGKGKNWHMPRYPSGNDPKFEEKFARKLRDLQRLANARERRIAKKTAEERASYKEWQRTHKPGDPAKRAAERERRRQAKLTRLALPSCQTEQESPAFIAAQRRLAELDNQIASLDREIREDEARRAMDNGEGVFG